jgi:hypothetical protein
MDNKQRNGEVRTLNKVASHDSWPDSSTLDVTEYYTIIEKAGYYDAKEADLPEATDDNNYMKVAIGAPTGIPYHSSEKQVWAPAPEEPEVVPEEAIFNPSPITPIDPGFDLVTASPYISSEDKKRKRICGLATSTFWIVASVLSVIIVAAIVGGAVAAVMGNNRSSSSTHLPPASANKTHMSPLLNQSRLAAVNWTDANKVRHFAVFSQDYTSSLVVSKWDSASQNWVVYSISGAMVSNDSSISAKPGSPLAAVANMNSSTGSFEMRLYYLTPSNIVRDVVSKDMGAKLWNHGVLAKFPPVTTDDDSPLTAMWHACEVDCSNDIYVTYVTRGDVRLLNSSDWSNSSYIAGADSNSPMIIYAMSSELVGNHTRGPFPELRIYYDWSGELKELQFLEDGEWYNGMAYMLSPPA